GVRAHRAGRASPRSRGGGPRDGRVPARARPRPGAHRSARRNAMIDAATIAKLRFLVVEDQGFQRWVAANVLTGLGAKGVICAPDGREALEFLVRADPPVDIVVSDLDMPEMDGMELIRHMGQTGRPISLILLSALERSLVASVEQMAAVYGV